MNPHDNLSDVNLDAFTVILPCFMEEITIHSSIKSLKKFGFNNIHVFDDASSDSTYKKALSAGAQVVRNSNFLGFSTTLLKGLYQVKTPYTLICSNPASLSSDSNILEFIEFGVSGNYSMLISGARPEISTNLSAVLKKRFGIFISEPGFDFVFLDSNLINVIQKKVATTNTNVYFEMIRHAIKNDLKIGVYPIKIPCNHLCYPIRSRIMRFIHLRIMHGPASYFDYVFPDTERRKVFYQITTGFIGYLLIRFVELLFSYLAK